MVVVGQAKNPNTLLLPKGFCSLLHSKDEPALQGKFGRTEAFKSLRKTDKTPSRSEARARGLQVAEPRVAFFRGEPYLPKGGFGCKKGT